MTFIIYNEHHWGGTQQIFMWGGSTLRSNPLAFYIPFFTKKVPLSYTFNSIDIWYPFHIPCLELCISFDRFK